jgi:hypothetical protein
MKLLKDILVEAMSNIDQDRVYDTMIPYTDDKGKNKKIKLRSALSYEKNHPAYKTAIKLLKWYDIKPPKVTPTKKSKAELPKKPSAKTKLKKADFKSSAEKDKKPIKQNSSVPVYKKMTSRERSPDDIRDAIIAKAKAGISDSAYSSIVKKQSDYWNNSIKNKDFVESVSNWRDAGIPKGRLEIDEFIKKNPPPPLKMKKPVWRGMGMTKPGYKKFLKNLEGKTEIKLPPMSFSFDANVAVEFANDYNQIILNVRSECNELNAVALSDLPGQDSIYSDKEKELITPSNATYIIESIKEVDFFWSNENISVVNLIQKCGMSEAEENVTDFSKDKFMDAVLGYTQKPS